MKVSSEGEHNSFLNRLISKVPTYFFILLVFILGVSLLRNIANVKNVNQELSEKEMEVQKARKEQQELQKKLEFAQSRDFIERQLRDKLGLAKEGEIVVVLPPPEVLRKIAPSQPVKEELLPDPNWKKWMNLFI